FYTRGQQPAHIGCRQFQRVQIDWAIHKAQSLGGAFLFLHGWGQRRRYALADKSHQITLGVHALTSNAAVSSGVVCSSSSSAIVAELVSLVVSAALAARRQMIMANTADSSVAMSPPDAPAIYSRSLVCRYRTEQ